MHKPTVLLTGFDAFGGESLNPSWEAVARLDGESIAGHRLAAAQLPTVFGDALDCLERLLDQHKPRLVLCLGQASGRTAISLERVAINVDDARIADNAGQQPVDQPILAEGPPAYFTSLPIKAMLERLHAAGIPAQVSNSAGTFVCNHVFYGLMHLLAARPGLRGGFVHIPYSPEQVVEKKDQPSMAMELVLKALRLMVETAVNVEHDIRLAAGTTE
ncbi:MAG: pyroglutamyl-peptidase I [Gammaproteobacteria bacterium]|nr:pyroglutamyl-peptidase I [Gammaproteobacteria bacterium]